jgi:hypothetical protein
LPAPGPAGSRDPPWTGERRPSRGTAPAGATSVGPMSPDRSASESAKRAIPCDYRDVRGGR